MKFTCNTKPLSDALDLGIINANVSNYHKKSNIVQLSILDNSLKINIETASIRTQVVLRGNTEGDGVTKIFVGSLILKQLVSSIESSTVTLDITGDSLVIASGKSRFTLPKLIDADEMDLETPSEASESAQWLDIDKNSWKFIKDNQLFALAISFIHPIYTRVWVGAEGDVLVGDFDNSLFTHSKVSKLGNTCLLSDTVINLLTSLPDGSKIAKASDNRNYLISANTDSYSYLSEFTPFYEADEGVGSYNSQTFLGVMTSNVPGIQCKASAIGKFLSQAELLSTSTDDVINLTVDANKVSLHDKNVNCSIDVAGQSETYTLQFKLATLKKIITNYGDADITIKPISNEGEIRGILVEDNTLTTMLAGVE